MGNPEYFKYFFQTNHAKSEVKSFIRKATVANLPCSDILRIKLYLPTIQEQEKIASFLGAVDTRISQLRRKHELLQTYKRGVMQKLFSQQIRFKCDDGKPFPDWEKKKLGDMAINGFSNGVFNDPSKVGWGYRLINVKDIYTSRSINVDSLTRLNLEEEEFIKNQAQYGDIFFTRSSLVKEGIAHSNILLTQDQDITYDGHLIRFRFNHESYLPQFVGLALKSAKVRQQLVARGKTGTMTTIGQEDIASVQAFIPCRQEQEKIAVFLTAIDNKIEAVAKQIELTEQFKKGLLQKMFV
jgi:type I restriction enzyme S subunit